MPTTAEAGLPEFQVSAWNGLFAPKGTPKPIVDQLADALDKALDDDDTRKRMLVLGCDIPDKSQRGPAPFLALVKSEIARWSPIIKAAGVTDELANAPPPDLTRARVALSLFPPPRGNGAHRSRVYPRSAS